MILFREILGSHGGEYEDVFWDVELSSLVGYIAPIIRAIIALMMEAASTSETSINFYQTTRRNNLEYSHL
jgi:hypothetical protein